LSMSEYTYFLSSFRVALLLKVLAMRATNGHCKG